MRQAPIPDIPESLLSTFESLPETPAASASRGEPVESVRFAAWQAFSNLGLPSTHDEDYSFTSTAELKNLLTRPVDAKAQVEFTFADGFEIFSLASGEVPESMLASWKETASRETDISSALAMALAAQPTALRLKAGSNVERPMVVTCHAAGAKTDAALFFEMEANSKAAISLASVLADANGFLNASVVVKLGANAELDFSQIDPAQGSQTLKLHFILERGAKLRLLTASTGGRFQRLALEVDLLESDCEIDLRGAGVIGGSNRSHRHVLIHHHAPDCVSRQLFKAVVLGSGRSSVDGTVVVERGAQHTDAKQLLRHLMLSKDAKADAKPRLFIHADDVKCGHGATVGKMDPDQLFYLRSRGIDPESANSLLTHAFLGEALDISTFVEFREAARTRLLAALEPSPIPDPAQS